MLSMAKRQILPAASQYAGALAASIQSVMAAGATSEGQSEMLVKVCELINQMNGNIENLEKMVNKTEEISNSIKQAESYRDQVIPAMAALRKSADELEKIVDAQLWPLPTYAEMLFVK